jgi:hypothetical protein
MRNRSASAAFKFFYDHKSTKNILFRHIFIQKIYLMTHFLFKMIIKVKEQSLITEKNSKRLHKNVNN